MQKLWQNLADKLHGLHLDRYFSVTSLLAVTPPSTWKYMWAYVAFIVISWIGGVVVNFLKIHTSLKARILPIFWTNAVLGLMLFFFRYEGVPLLGMDLWRFLQELATVIWIIMVFRYSRTGLQQELVAEKAVAYKKKYLPKAK